MRARWWWSLLLLAAVFAMHGPSSAAADTTPSVAGAATPLATMSSAGVGAPVDGHTLAGSAAGDQAHPAASFASFASFASGDMHATAAGSSTGHPAGHDPLLHALVVCLAVLVGGVGAALASLAVWLARHRLAGAATELRVGVELVAYRAMLWARGPELSRLCVLRI